MKSISHLLKQLSENRLNAEERSALLQWIRENKEDWAYHLYDEYCKAAENEEQPLEPERSDFLLKNIQSRIGFKYADQEDDENDNVIPLWKRLYTYRIYVAVAASIIMLVSLFHRRPIEPLSARHDEITSVELSPKQFINIENNRQVTLPVALPDGSSVLLYPESKLSYPASFRDQREISLSGKAFFEVVKMPNAPFIVYANEMVTRVLGTSFLISAFDNRNEFAVSVKTGVVTVAAQTEKKSVEVLTEVQLKANEEAMFNRKSQKIIRSEIPAILHEEMITPPLLENYKFRNTPVKEILSTIENDYSIKIQLDHPELIDCSLTTSLKDKSLFEKIRIVCEAIGPGTNYTVQDGVVLISTRGCNR